MLRKLGNVLVLLGVMAMIAATAWWYSFFHEILGDNFQMARECFYWTSNTCSLKHAAALFADLPEYEPYLLWFGAGLFSVGVVLRIGEATSPTG